MIKILVPVIITSVLVIVDSARILAVYPTPSISHQVVFRVLSKELAKRGHEVVVITTNPEFSKKKAPANLTEIDIHDVSYGYYQELLTIFKNEFVFGDTAQRTEQMQNMYQLHNVLERQVRSEHVQELLNSNEKFDLLLIEAYFRPALVFSHIFKAPVILVSSFGATLENLEAIGAPTHPVFYPLPFRIRMYNMSLWEKITEYYYHAQVLYYDNRNIKKEDALLQRIFGPNVPSVSELVKNVEMLFLNVHPIWMDNIPVPPGVIFMGGLHQIPEKPLPLDLKSYLDSSKNGVIYVSFGSNVHPMMFPPDKLKIIIESLSDLPYDILFKWNDEELPGRTDNIRISKWLPQSDVLRHPNVKAFLMQGGLQSTDEAITAGVPLVCIPMLGDQWYNAEKYEHFKIGVKLDLMTLTKPTLMNALNTVISNKSYRENIVRLRKQMSDQPQTPLERAVWWTEYVLRHGGARHLRAPAANMSWREYYDIDLVLIILTALLFILFVSLYAVLLLSRFVSSLMRSSSSVKVKRS